jgi:RNA polymerase sigma-70 factor (ECF subfamily)
LAIAVASDAHAGEEIAQDALLAASDRAAGAPGNLKSWLAGAVRKLHRRRARSDADRKARERQAARPDVVDDPTLALERLEIQEALSAAVRELEEPYRTTVLQRWYEGLEPQRIAERTGVPVRTVHTRVTRALAMLRETLDRRSHGDRTRWMAAWAPLMPGTSNVVKVTLMGIKVKVAVAVALVAVGVTAMIPRPGEDYESAVWMDEYGYGHTETKHCYPRVSIFAPRVPEYSVSELYLPDRSLVRLGPFTRWARDGKKLEEGDYEYGKRTGSWTFWNDDGSVDHVKSGVYENDVKVRD